MARRRSPRPAVYFGLGQSGYVVADTAQSEVDYSDTNGNTVSSHYTGKGGVPIGSFWTKAAFALQVPRPQPAHLEPGYQELEADVQPGRSCPCCQGGAFSLL